MKPGGHVHVPFDVRLVAKVGFSVAVAAFLGLWLLMQMIGDEKGNGYAMVIGIFGFAKQSLASAMLVFGFTLVGFAGITAWLFSLYASFRVAGPLYRFSRDLESLLLRDDAAPIPVRGSDGLQEEWKAFDASVAWLRAHDAELRQALGKLDSALQQDAREPAEAAVARLREVEQGVTF